MPPQFPHHLVRNVVDATLAEEEGVWWQQQIRNPICEIHGKCVMEREQKAGKRLKPRAMVVDTQSNLAIALVSRTSRNVQSLPLAQQ